MKENSFEKPHKPVMDEFGLTDQALKSLSDCRKLSAKKTNKFLISWFVVLSITGTCIILSYEVHGGFIILSTLASAIIVWGLIPFVIKLIKKRDVKDLFFMKESTEEIKETVAKNKEYIEAFEVYKQKNELYERVVRRATWSYWLSLNPIEFEEAVAELFLDKGYKVEMTPSTGDNGVDLYIEKDGKKGIVQCKTYKKVIGPSIAREVYGTMVAEKVDEAFLAAPGGFSNAAKDFCDDKPLSLLDLDELTKMTYTFENYTPHWLDTAKSMDDIRKGVDKHIYKRQYKRKKY